MEYYTSIFNFFLIQITCEEIADTKSKLLFLFDNVSNHIKILQASITWLLLQREFLSLNEEEDLHMFFYTEK